MTTNQMIGGNVINTQGMSYGNGESGKTIEEQRAAIPPLGTKQMNLLSDALKAELKDLINEVLDERKYIVMQEEPKQDFTYPSYHTDYKGCVDFLVDSMSTSDQC